MGKLKNELWENLLGYVPDRELKEMILTEVAATGKDIREVITEGKIIPYMPETGILDDNGLFEYKGKRMTAKEFETVNPLGEYAKIVIIGRKEQIEKHRNIDKELKQQLNGTEKIDL